MITQPTTLILGAGASKPFGFPTGKELMSRVIGYCDEVNSFLNTQRLFEDAGFTLSEVNAFRNALSKSGRNSVDAFLEHRPEFMDIGKVAIAAVLIPYEKEASLFGPNGSDWYQYLFEILNTPFDDFNKNKLSVLTFNYDRSFEHYLITALMNAYGKTRVACFTKVKAIQVNHLHGDLGELDEDNLDNYRAYDRTLDTVRVRIAAKRIKIVSDGTIEKTRFEAAKALLSHSAHICFLGFGYHPTNMRRLGFDDPAAYPSARHWGSSFGMTFAEREWISNKYNARLMFPESSADCEVLQFLRRSGVLNNASSSP